MKKPEQNKKKIIGLTGGFGTGKSTVAAMFKKFGAGVIDADRISHDLIKPGGEVYRKIVRIFGKGILDESGIVNRRKLGGIVFENKNNLAKFNGIMHPEIKSRIKCEIKYAKENIVVLDAPLLLETGLEKLADIVVVVSACRDSQFVRIKKRNKFTEKEIGARIKSQMPLKDKLRSADFVIDNNGTIKNTRKQVALMHEALIRRLWWRS